MHRCPTSKCVLFLSTPSARRATPGAVILHHAGVISIHALREEGDRSVRGLVFFTYISIHALREEGDRSAPRYSRRKSEFLSTPSARRATIFGGYAPLAHEAFLSTPSARRATCLCHLHVAGLAQFLSTPSARRATTHQHHGWTAQQISIHALREEGDIFACMTSYLRSTFLSTPSARRATQRSE